MFGAKFKRLILNEEYEEALDICRTQVEEGAQVDLDALRQSNLPHATFQPHIGVINQDQAHS
jgi:predicted transcriptional regulator